MNEILEKILSRDVETIQTFYQYLEQLPDGWEWLRHAQLKSPTPLEGLNHISLHPSPDGVPRNTGPGVVAGDDPDNVRQS